MQDPNAPAPKEKDGCSSFRRECWPKLKAQTGRDGTCQKPALPKPDGPDLFFLPLFLFEALTGFLSFSACRRYSSGTFLKKYFRFFQWLLFLQYFPPRKRLYWGRCSSSRN